jgi:hypothetical protein
MRAIKLGVAVVELHDNDTTITRLNNGRSVPAAPQRNSAYRERARSLGYGSDTAAMSREHEIAHSILAAVLGLKESPTLAGVAAERFWPFWDKEEAAVLAFQAYARAAGIDLVEVAVRLSRIMERGSTP